MHNQVEIRVQGNSMLYIIRYIRHLEKGRGGKNKPFETVVGQAALKCDQFGRKATMAFAEEMF